MSPTGIDGGTAELARGGEAAFPFEDTFEAISVEAGAGVGEGETFRGLRGFKIYEQEERQSGERILEPKLRNSLLEVSLGRALLVLAAPSSPAVLP